ncbi:MAG: hypothetical protein AAF389_09185 [Gemmatimonadota bacterium]
MDNATLGVIVLGFFSVAAAFSLRALLDSSYRFALDSVTGEVMRERQRSETEVSGSISGGGSGSHRGVSGSMSSSTTLFQSIFLRLPNGKEREITFEDFEIPCREGHQLTIVHASRSGRDSHVVAYHNHATEQSFPVESSIAAVVRPPMDAAIGVWGLAAFGLGMISMWNDGTWATDRVKAIGVSLIVGVILGGVAWAILRVLSFVRGGPRASTLRTAIGSEIAAVEARIESPD